MNIRAWMTAPVHCLKPLDSVKHARELMEKHRINQMPVAVEGRLIGIVTDRDLRDASPSVFEGPSHQNHDQRDDIPVRDVMSQKVLTLTPADSIAAAAQLMRRERIGSLPIVEAEHPVGILTRSDLLKALVALAETPTREAD